MARFCHRILKPAGFEEEGCQGLEALGNVLCGRRVRLLLNLEG